MTTPIGLRLINSKEWKSQLYIDKSRLGEFVHLDAKVRNYYNYKLNYTYNNLYIQRKLDSTTLTLVTNNALNLKEGGIVSTRLQYPQKALKINRIVAAQGSNKTLNLDSTHPSLLVSFFSSFIASRLLSGHTSFSRIADEITNTFFSRLPSNVGILIRCSGPFKGASMAATKWISYGSVPLNSLSAPVYYSYLPIHLTTGVLGLKVWLYQR